jgi:hypothetical protein
MAGLDFLVCSYHGHPGVLVVQLWPPGENNALYYTSPREPAVSRLPRWPNRYCEVPDPWLPYIDWPV